MVFSFTLPTTSHLSFQSYYSSPSHPSLPQCASTARHALRTTLKKHKRLSPSQKSSNLPSVLAALNAYIPYLFVFSQSRKSTNHSASNPAFPAAAGEEEIQVSSTQELEVEWRATLSSNSSALPSFIRRDSQQPHSRVGLGSSRIKGKGIEFEIAFVLSTLGYVLTALARSRYLKTIYANATPTTEQKASAVQAAVKYLLQASSVHAYLSSSSALSGLCVAAFTSPITSTSISAVEFSPPQNTNPASYDGRVPDLDSSTQSALSTLALAEATLLAVVKDDAYLSACIQSRNKYDNEWMIKSPDIPKVRALLFARLCVRAAEYAEQAVASAGAVGGSGRGGKVDEELLGYMRVLIRVSKAKACRFFGIDADLASKTGEGIAWLRAGKVALGFKESLAGDEPIGSEESMKGRIGGGFSRLKREWSGRREERKVEKEAISSRGSEREAELDWGDDAGREEEGRVIDMLEARWMKMNDTVSFLPFVCPVDVDIHVYIVSSQ